MSYTFKSLNKKSTKVASMIGRGDYESVKLFFIEMLSSYIIPTLHTISIGINYYQLLPLRQGPFESRDFKAGAKPDPPATMSARGLWVSLLRPLKRKKKGLLPSSIIILDVMNNNNTGFDFQLAGDLRRVLDTLLQHLQVPYKVVSYDENFYDNCMSTARERGYPIGADLALPSILPFLPTGVAIAQMAYSHVESESTKIFIALYTTFVTCLDDVFQRDIEKMYLFNERFIRQQEHEDPVLDGLSDILGDIHLHSSHIASNLIVTDTLNFVTSLLLDYETQGIKRSNYALEFPKFMRLYMSGISSVYTMFIFPTDMPLRSYVQALPEMRTIINFLNDVLSFYKEEIRGEEDNYISITSASSGRRKFEVFQAISEDIANANDQILKILDGEREVLRAWNSFVNGYVHFHASCPRYRLDQLMGRVYN